MTTTQALSEFRSVKPALGRVAITPLTTEEVTRGGIILPYGSEELGTCGQVSAVCDPYSSGDVAEGPIYRVGQIVLYGKYSGTDVKLGRGKRFIIMRETDVMATLTKEE